MDKANPACHKDPPNGGLVAVGAVAAYLGVSRSKVYQLMDQGDLAYVKLGKSRRISWNAVTKLVERNTVGDRSG